jgi:hypothetical protein
LFLIGFIDDKKHGYLLPVSVAEQALGAPFYFACQLHRDAQNG